MTHEATRNRGGYEIPSWEFVEAFAAVADRRPMGADIEPAVGELMQDTFLPVLETLPPPTDFDSFNDRLCHLEAHFGHAARQTMEPQAGRFVGLAMDGIEDYILETKTFPEAFPDRKYKPLGEVKFRGIRKLPIYIERRIRPVYHRGSRIETEEQCDAWLDEDIDYLACRYAEQMGRKVEFGDQYRQYLEALRESALDAARNSGSRYHLVDRTYTNSRGIRGETTFNVVAKTREHYLRGVFANIEQRLY